MASAEQKGGLYVDATFGRGGHSTALLQSSAADVRCFAIDRDPEAVRFAREHVSQDPRFAIEHAPFSKLRSLCERKGYVGKIDGLFADLGVSSPQLDQGHRGFSFLRDGPLDMRMDPSSGESCSAWLARASQEEIADVIHRYGEERFARRIARTLVAARTIAPIETTRQLAEWVEKAVPFKEKNKHPATRTFQAFRIYINQELEELKALLASAWDLLNVGGRLVILSFHSLEDREVKQFLRGPSQRGVPRSWLGLNPKAQARWNILKKQKPSAEECARNRRARSAVLRIAEKLG